MVRRATKLHDVDAEGLYDGGPGGVEIIHMESEI